jgi:hypothetical protein
MYRAFLILVVGFNTDACQVKKKKKDCGTAIFPFWDDTPISA